MRWPAAEQSAAEVRILVLRPDVARQLERGEELVELRGGVVSIRIGGIFRMKIRGQPRKTGGVGGQIDEGDLLSVALGHPHVRREILRNGIGERHFAALDCIGEEQRCEDLRHRADLEDGIGVDRFFSCLGARVSDRAPAGGIDDADDDADALPLHVNAVGKDRADVLVRQHRAGPRIGENEAEDDRDALER
jgi:hypothetical protein